MDAIECFQESMQELFYIRGIKTLSQFSRVSGINYISLCHWMHGKVCPHIDSIVAIADYFNCSTDYLFELCDSEEFSRSKHPSNFSERFISLTQTASLTDYKVAQECGCSYSAATGWRHRGQIPQIPTLVKLPFILNCSLDYLIGRSDYL